jgi:PPOX class probable F420-dependent enzyme
MLHVEHRCHYRGVVIDPTTEKGARADERLRTDRVAWLITVAGDGNPVPTPVWFWWDGSTILVYSQRDKPKLRHIAANPRVSLALRTDELGDEITVITGEAVVAPSLRSADQVPEYLARYGELIARLGADPASFAGEYSVPIRITPTKLRQWRSASAE